MGEFKDSMACIGEPISVNEIRLMASKEASSYATRCIVYAYLKECGVLDKRKDKDEILDFLFDLCKEASELAKFLANEWDGKFGADVERIAKEMEAETEAPAETPESKLFNEAFETEAEQEEGAKLYIAQMDQAGKKIDPKKLDGLRFEVAAITKALDEHFENKVRGDVGGMVREDIEHLYGEIFPTMKAPESLRNIRKDLAFGLRMYEAACKLIEEKPKAGQIDPVTATNYAEYLAAFGKTVDSSKIEGYKKALFEIKNAYYSDDETWINGAKSLAAEILPDLIIDGECTDALLSDLKMALSMYEVAARYLEKDSQKLYNSCTQSKGVNMARKKTKDVKRVSRKPIRIRLADNHEEWLEQRKQGIGGSDAANILGMGYESPLTTFLDKTGQLPPIEDNLPMKLGRALEQTVADLFTEETGIKCRKSGYMFQSRQHEFMLANIDRLTDDGTFLECKTTTEWNAKKIAFKGDIPAHWYCQCTHYMAVLGVDHCYLAVLIGNREFVHFRIERDEEDIKALIEEEEKFWQMVKAGEFTGDPCGTARESQSLSKAYPEPKQAGITFHSDKYEIRLREAEQAANEADEKAKAAKEVLEGVKNEIKLLMGNDALEFKSGNAVCTWKTKETPRIDKKALEKAYPEIAKEFTKVTRTREFRYKFLKGE